MTPNLNYNRTALSNAEHAVLELAADGMNLVEIAKYRHVGVNTVKTQMNQVRHILGAYTIAHAVALAMRQGLIK